MWTEREIALTYENYIGKVRNQIFESEEWKSNRDMFLDIKLYCKEYPFVYDRELFIGYKRAFALNHNIAITYQEYVGGKDAVGTFGFCLTAQNRTRLTMKDIFDVKSGSTRFQDR